MAVGQSKSSERQLWMVNQYAIAPDMPGGRRHFELASLLVARGWKTTIFATPQNYVMNDFARPLSWTKPSSTETISGVNFRWLYSLPYTRNNWRRYVNMVSFAAMVAGAGLISPRPDVVIGSSPHLLAALGAWAVARRHRVPFVLEVRDLWPETLVQLGLSSRPIIRTLEWMERFLYKHADLIVPLTEGIADGVRHKGFGHKNIVMVPNASLRPKPLDIDQRDAMRERLGWEGKQVAIWIGAHGPANGLDVIIDAAKLLESQGDLIFVLVGGGPDKDRLIERARGLNTVQFLDPIPKDDVDQYLRAADIALLVHRDTEAVKGARPNKLFDYMAAGLPIVLNIDGEARRLMEAAEAGVYVPAEEPRALADAIAELLEDSACKARLGQNGYLHVACAHSREDTAKTLAQVLGTLLGTQETTSEYSTRS